MAQAHGEEACSDAAYAPGAIFRSAATNNLCSRCYLGHLKSVEAASVEAKIKADSSALALPSIRDSAAAAAGEAPATKATPSRCMACKKKVGLLGFACRCGGTFCSLHRYGDAHACCFDYKKADREKIAKENPLIAASKINKI